MLDSLVQSNRLVEFGGEERWADGLHKRVEITAQEISGETHPDKAAETVHLPARL